MKILHVASGLQKASGVTTFVENLVAELRALGHEVDIATRASLAANRQVLTINRYDIVHLHGIWEPCVNRVARTAFRAGVPVVWSTHGMTAPWSLRHKWWKKCLYWWLIQKPLLKRAALIHVTVEKEGTWNKILGLGSHARNRCGNARGSLIVPLGTRLPSLPSLTFCSSTLKTLLFVGRIYPVKALDRLIRGFACAIQPSTSWRLRIVGPDQAGHMAELMSLCNQLGIPYTDRKGNLHCPPTVSTFTSMQPQVEFAGPKYGAELDAEYENCDCLALVSHTENFGATVADAMAHGKPVITSTGTPWGEVEGRCGWWVENEVETLSGAIREMMGLSDEERRKMGIRGRKLVEEKYTWQAVARTMAEGYESVGGRPSSLPFAII